MREPVLILCAVYLGGLLAVYAYIAYRWFKGQKEAWGEWCRRDRGI